MRTDAYRPPVAEKALEAIVDVYSAARSVAPVACGDFSLAGQLSNNNDDLTIRRALICYYAYTSASRSPRQTRPM